MASTRKSSKNPPAVTWSSGGSPHELDEVDRIAHGIVTDRPDLFPSVSRIMNAELDADGRRKALTLFGDALHTPGDVHRDPRVAIEACLPPGGVVGAAHEQ